MTLISFCSIPIMQNGKAYNYIKIPIDDPRVKEPSKRMQWYNRQFEYICGILSHILHIF